MAKIKFKRLIGYVKDSSFIAMEIEKGNNADSIGDQMYISKCGTMMEISDMADAEIYKETMTLFDKASMNAFKGAMLRMGIIF